MDTHKQTAAEVLALAICELFPTAQLLTAHITGISFAYDFQFDQPFDNHLLLPLEEKMREISKRRIPVERVEMMPRNAKELFQHQKQWAKAEQLEEVTSSTLPLIRIGKFYDSFLPGIGSNTDEMGVIRLSHFEEWENFIRIHGFAFADKKIMTAFLKQQEKAKKSDHTLLGEPLKFFFLAPDDKITWLPKGALLRRRLIQWWEEEQQKENFSFTYTPPPENPVQTHEAAFAKNAGSRFCEVYSRSGKSPYPFFRGLLTSEVETTDLATLYCSREELIQELTSSLQFIEKTINIFGFEHHWFLITAGRRKTDHSALLQNALKQCNIDFRSEDREIAHPKIEVRIKDAFGQEWPGAWVEVEIKRSLIRRSLFGSLEQFVALLMESKQGRLPLWLAPEPVRIMVVGERNAPFARRVAAELTQLGCIPRLNISSESLGQKIKAAIEEKIPCIAVIGDKEEKSNSVTIREDDNREINMTAQSFIDEIAKKFSSKGIN